MIIVNDAVFQTDTTQPHLLHGTLNPATDFAQTALASLPVGTMYIARVATTGTPCNTTVTTGCLWVKEGTPGDPCATSGSKSDWRRLGCSNILTGTAAPSSTGIWCQAEAGDIYMRTVGSWTLYYQKVNNRCDSPWINLSKGCLFERSATPVGVTNDANLCALPVPSFIYVNGVGTFLKVKNNCDGNDWVPLQTDISNVQDMRNVTSNPNDAALAKPTYDIPTRTLNIPPPWVVSIRRNLATAGQTTVAANAASVVDFDTMDLNTSQNNANALTLNKITVPFNGVYRATVLITLQGKTAAVPWRANMTFNAATLQKWLWTSAPSGQLPETNFTEDIIVPLTAGTQIGFDITNLDTTSSMYNSVHLTLELMGT